MSTRNDALASAYKQFCEELNNALYEEDPASMGSTVGAPRDEYEGEAARLASALRASGAQGDVAAHLHRMFGHYSEPLLARVNKAFAKFRVKCKTAMEATSNG